MEEVELKIENIYIKLRCENPDKLRDLFKKLTLKVQQIKKENRNISDTKALLVTSLNLMDEIDQLNRNIQELKVSFYDKQNNKN